jgi:hypothetical protein
LSSTLREPGQGRLDTFFVETSAIMKDLQRSGATTLHKLLSAVIANNLHIRLLLLAMDFNMLSSTELGSKIACGLVF